MKTRTILVALVGALLAAPLTAGGQSPTNVARIGYLSVASAAANAQRVEAFRRGLSELGYVEGRNIAMEWRWADGKLDRLPALAAELVRLHVAVIVATGNEPVRAAKNATRTIPIVMGFSSDPVADGFITSLARPGGNITGLSSLGRDLSGKRLELLREAIPKLSRLSVVWNPAIPVSALTLKETEAAAQALGIQLQSVEVRSPDDFDAAFKAIIRHRADALIVVSDGTVASHRARMVDLVTKNRLPAMYTSSDFAPAGGLMTYGVNVSDNLYRAASYVDRILKGAKPADLPVEQPRKFELAINLKAAKAVGLTIPQSLLLQADQVVP